MMERCPNCGTPARPGAKFCTTCGFRFPGDESNAEVIETNDNSAAPSDTGESTEITAEAASGWPAPPPSHAFSPGAWDRPAESAMTAPSAAPDEPAEVASGADSWPNETVDAWPDRPAADAAIPVSVNPQFEGAALEPAHEAPAADRPEDAESITRAMRLLDELRDVICGMGPHATLDLSGVISDLEVAVTPPGAMAADEVAELREALLAARERPRDVDTIVDLSNRLDKMLALVIAYDRAIAAIERSLEALRGDRVAVDMGDR